MSAGGYALRCELHGHEEDVRGVLACDIGLVTSSRDKTVKLWVEDGASSYQLLSTLVGHSDYVGPLLYLTPGLSPEFPQGAVVSGSRDTTIIVWDPLTAAALQTLRGHGYQVTALAALPTGEIVSASLDKTIHVWRGGKCIQTLEGHEAAVLSMVVMPNGDILSGSGDTTIRQWSNGRCTNTFRGHTDTVRGLAVLPNVGFVSGSHDFTVKVWTAAGQVLSELLGHTAIVYAVAATADGLIASASEDNTMRLWQASGQSLAVIEHPGCVWDVRFLPNGDVLTGCGDSVARVFSADAARQTDAETQAAFTSAIVEKKASKSAADSSQAAAGSGQAALPPGLKVVDATVLLQPGSKDGETKVVREVSGAINAYCWSTTMFQWEMIGEVVPGPAGGGAAPGKKFHKGQEWDYVFDVDVEEGAMPRKLPYNLSENPYMAADRFLEEEGLPAYFKEQVVQFILSNTNQGPAKQSFDNMPITGGFCDPFTGGTSSGASAPPQPCQPPPTLPTKLPVTGGVNPFTGGSAGSSHQPSSLTHVPMRAYLVFDNMPALEALTRKLHEFNAVLQQDPSTSGLALTEAEGQGLASLLHKLPAAAAAGPSAAGVLQPADMALLRKLLTWPRQQLFPVLDIARIAVLDAAGAAALVQQAGALSAAVAAAAAEHSIPANQQLALRLLTNCFKHDVLRNWVLQNRSALLDAYSGCLGSGNKAVRLSIASLLANYAVYAHLSGSFDPDGKMQVLSALVEFLAGVPLEETDTVFRALLALGTICYRDTEMTALARDLGIQDTLRKINDSPEAQLPAGRKLLEGALDMMTLIMGRG